MQKRFFLNLIVLTFLSMAMNYCHADDFFIDTQFQELKNQTPKILQNVSDVKKKAQKNIQQKKSFFQNLFKRNKDDGYETKKEFNSTTNRMEEIPRGYYGTLPNIEEDFKYKKQITNSSSEIDAIPLDEAKEEDFKKAPYDDSLFLDMIAKPEEESTYLKDLQKIKFTLNNLKNCLENSYEIQRYNATVNLLDLYCKNLRKKYEDKKEANNKSYISILNANYYAKKLGNLKYDANYYARYIPVNDGQYSKDNISLEEEKLLNLVNKTLFLINEEK